MTAKEASILIPVHNESEIVKKNVKLIWKTVKGLELFDNFEILLCDNGSTDITPEIIEAVSKSTENIKAISVAEKGIGHGLRSGIMEAKYEILVFYPIDLSFNLYFIADAFSKIENENYDLVIGSKGHKESIVKRSKSRGIFSAVFNLLINFFLRLNIKDTQGALMFKRSHVTNFLDKIISNDLFFTVELIAYSRKFNLRILEIPVKVEDERKSSKINPFKDGFFALVKILQTAWRIRL